MRTRTRSWWLRLRVQWACWLMRAEYAHSIIDADGAVIALILARDGETYQRLFTVGPRYHTTTTVSQSELVH